MTWCGYLCGLSHSQITKDIGINGKQKCETLFASMYEPDIITKEPGCADAFILQLRRSYVPNNAAGRRCRKQFGVYAPELAKINIYKLQLLILSLPLPTWLRGRSRPPPCRPSQMSIGVGTWEGAGVMALHFCPDFGLKSLLLHS